MTSVRCGREGDARGGGLAEGTVAPAAAPTDSAVIAPLAAPEAFPGGDTQEYVSPEYGAFE